jgi:choline dehydrogenase-like flavoprotein
MADDNVDVAIVGSGFAGALIANELAKKGKRVVILEAGDGIPTDINKYMERFYKAAAKVPESPYTPELFDDKGHFSEKINDPSKAPNGRPTVMTLGPGDWDNPTKSYLVQSKVKDNGEPATPFASTYDRIAGGTSHWLGTCLRFVPADFEMRKRYPNCPKEFVDWPISYFDLERHYRKAEEELGVSADATDQNYLDIKFVPSDYRYPMPRIPESLTDRAVRRALKNLEPAHTAFLGMPRPPTQIPVRGVPAARNSQPYKNRRACAGNTNCIPICPIQAKYDPTITLNEALSRKSVTMMKNTVAKEIVLDGDLRRVTQIDYIDYGSGPTQKEGSIKARIFVIAANAIETPRLLLMSKNKGRKPEGVANSSGKVGRYLMDHPYLVAWGLLPDRANPLYPYRGPLITSGIEDLCDGPFRNERGAFRMDIGNEGWNFVVAAGKAGADPDVTTIDFVNGVNRTGLNGDGNTGAGMFGKDLIDKLNKTITRQFRVGFLVEQSPDPENRVTLSERPDGSPEHIDRLGLPRPKIAYSLSPYTKRGIVVAKQLQKLLFQKMDAADFTTVWEDDPTQFEEKINGEQLRMNYVGAGHIMGTYRMGDKKKPKESVVDSFQCSHDHDNLYLVGSGTFPTGATANPTLTLAALALRTAEQIAKRV